MYSNQNLALNGAPITDMSVSPFPKEHMIAAQQGAFDSSVLLSSFLSLDPNRNMLLLQTAWDKQVMKKETFASSVYRRVVSSNAVLNVNGQDGGFKYKIAVDTDNCFRTVDNTSDQSPDGYVGADGSSFKIVLNKKLSPNQVLTVDPLSELYLVVDDVEVEYVGYGYVHFVKLLGSENDTNKVYPTEYLGNDVTYTVMSNSFIAEYSEKLGTPHLPESTKYQELEFKLGSGQGAEHWFTGKSDSIKMSTGYTTADTQKYIDEVRQMGLDADNPLALIKATGASGSITTVADMLEILTVRSFNTRFNKSLMFMMASKFSSSKGVLEFNEGLWQQLMRGKRFKYNKKGGLTENDLVAIRNYVYKYNTSRAEDTFLRIEAGSELTFNIERIIAKHAQAQIANLSVLLGDERRLPSNPISGSLDALVVAPVKFAKAVIPGVGMLSVTMDSSLDHIADADVRTRGVNPGGKDHTTYSGYIWDVTDQSFSSNAKLPEGTKAVGGETMASHNVYLIKPERNAIVWGRENGRYSSKKASDVIASSKLMAEGFWIYGFGAMWMPDPSKFLMIELKNKLGGAR
jgi:hypothetical protein